MNIPSPFAFRFPRSNRSTLLGAVSIGVCLVWGLSATSFGQITYTWDGGAGTSSWQDADNWSPNGLPSGSTRDPVVINSAVTVTSASLIFVGNFTPSTTYTLLTLSGGANLSIAGDLTVGTASNVTRNMAVGAGSQLSATGTINVGVVPGGNNSRTSTWTILGDVVAETFQGNQANGTGTGGYLLNVSGGSLKATTFDWYLGSAVGANVLNAQINLSLGGVADFQTMSSDWDDYAHQKVNFVDGSGSLTFGKTNWETISLVQGLIDAGHVTKDVLVTDEFQIFDGGSYWVVSVVPEPSALSCVAGAILGLFWMRRRLSVKRQSLLR